MADLRIPRMNKVMISGRIVNDIEMRYTAKGKPVLRITLAVDKSYKDESGTWQQLSSYLDVVCWDKWAEAVNGNAHKGSPVIVEGRLDARSYVDNNNQNRKVVEIIAEYIQFLEVRQKADTTISEVEPTPMPEDDTPATVTTDDVPF